MTPDELILSLCREAGDDITDETAVIEAFKANHNPFDILAAANGDLVALIQLRRDCGLPEIR